jgi:hypothetical protein
MPKPINLSRSDMVMRRLRSDLAVCKKINSTITYRQDPSKPS